MDVGGQSLHYLGKGVDLLPRALLKPEKALAQLLGATLVPVQQGGGVLPLLQYGGVIQQLAEHQIGDGLATLIDREEELAQAGVAAIAVKIGAGFPAAPDSFGIAGHTARIAAGHGLDGVAEITVSVANLDVAAVGVEDVGPDAGEGVKIGDQADQLVVAEQYTASVAGYAHGVAPFAVMDNTYYNRYRGEMQCGVTENSCFIRKSSI